MQLRQRPPGVPDGAALGSSLDHTCRFRRCTRQERHGSKSRPPAQARARAPSHCRSSACSIAEQELLMRVGFKWSPHGPGEPGEPGGALVQADAAEELESLDGTGFAPGRARQRVLGRHMPVGSELRRAERGGEPQMVAAQPQAGRVVRRAEGVQMGPAAEGGARPGEPEMAGREELQGGADLRAGRAVVEVVTVVEAHGESRAPPGTNRRGGASDSSVDRGAPAEQRTPRGRPESKWMGPVQRPPTRPGRPERSRAPPRKGPVQPEHPHREARAALTVTLAARTGGASASLGRRPAGNGSLQVSLPPSRRDVPNRRREWGRARRAKEAHVALMDE